MHWGRIVATLDLTNIYSLISPSFYWLLNDTNRNIFCYGGAGSGKSFSIQSKLTYDILRDFDKPRSHHILCMCKTYPQARRSVLPAFEEIFRTWGIENLYEPTYKSDKTFKFINGSKIQIDSLDDPKKIKSIYGVDKIFLEEADSFTLEDFKQINLRLRGKGKIFQIYAACNPVDKNSWLYDRFVINKKETDTVHHSTYHDNPWIDDFYKESLEELIKQDENFYRIYTLGKWGSLQNVIYSNYTIIDVIPDSEETIYGIDFGYKHPTTVIEIRRSDDEYFVRERLCESGMTNADLIRWLNNSSINKTDCIYADSANPPYIDEIAQEGYNIFPADKSAGSVRAGIDFCKRSTLYIYHDSVDLINELRSYSWKVDRDGKIVGQGEPVKFKDDCVDAMRYALYTHYFERNSEVFFFSTSL